jgi:hypothetical protein
MRDEFKPAIAALLADLKEIDRKGAETKRAINRLCELAGGPPMFDNIDTESRASVTALRTDQFYGKVLNTAAREYLDMRKAANLGPAMPREIYEALVEGGFKFDTKSETNAITALRQVLRKNSSTFHRLPHGAYGLLAWYPNAKAAKHDDANEEAEHRPAKRAPKPMHAPKPRRIKLRHAPAARAAAPKKELKERSGHDLAPHILQKLSDGKDWTVASLKEEAMWWGIPGLTPENVGRKLQGTLLSLNKKKLVQNTGAGAWRKAPLMRVA